MNDTTAASSACHETSPPRALRHTLVVAIWRHRILHTTAFGAFILALFVGSQTGTMPDTGVVSSFGFDLFIVFWLAGSLVAAQRLIYLAVRKHDPAPLRTMLADLRTFIADHDRLANALNGIAAMFVFGAAFGVLKGAVAVLVPFHWDQTLAAWDSALHFGRPPHEWLWWIAESPLALRLINIAYNFWFAVLAGSMLFASISRRDTRLRHQFLISLVLLWVLGGFFVAMGFSSAGPCYFARLGLGPRFQPLMDALASANETYTIWALSTQDVLWNGFIDAADGSMGISAFPSMHVATAVLFALYATRFSRFIGLGFWLFAAVIMVGSVVLGWHYAIDGYAGAILCIVIWRGTGLFLDRFASRELPTA